MNSVIESLANWSYESPILKEFLGILPILGIAIFLTTIYSSAVKKGLKLSLRIAVIGAPRSGKTTLITVVFDEIMSGKMARYMSVSGQETVARLTNYLNALKTGVNLGPTEDKDVFSYRYSVDRRLFGIPTKYDVEIADFPGEYSEDISSDLSTQEHSNGLYKKEFFSWVVRADRYIFTIDTEKYLNDPGSTSKFVAKTEVAFKNAILLLKQELLDEKIYERSALIVFTKCDLLAMGNSLDPATYHRDNSTRDSSITNLDKSKKTFEKFDEMQKDFSNLISFIKNNFKTTDIVFHSSYSNDPIFQKANKEVVDFTSPN